MSLKAGLCNNHTGGDGPRCPSKEHLWSSFYMSLINIVDIEMRLCLQLDVITKSMDSPFEEFYKSKAHP